MDNDQIATSSQKQQYDLSDPQVRERFLSYMTYFTLGSSLYLFEGKKVPLEFLPTALLCTVKYENASTLKLEGFELDKDTIYSIAEALEESAQNKKISIWFKQCSIPFEAMGAFNNKYIGSLEITSCKNMTPQGICDFSENVKVSSINLSYNHIKDDSANHLAKNTTIRKLELTHVRISTTGVLALSTKISLRTLDLSNSNLSDRHAQSISNTKTLRNLVLSENSIGDIGASALAKNSSIHKLVLSGNKGIGAKGIEALSQSNSIRILDLSSCDIGSEKICAFKPNTTLHTLILSRNNIKHDGIRSLIKNTSLYRLDLSYNRIDDDGAAVLSEDSSVRILYLNGNCITNKGAKYLSKSNTIKEIDLESNQIYSVGLRILSKNTSMYSINLGEDPRYTLKSYNAFLDNTNIISLHVYSVKIRDPHALHDDDESRATRNHIKQNYKNHAWNNAKAVLYAMNKISIDVVVGVLSKYVQLAPIGRLCNSSAHNFAKKVQKYMETREIKFNNAAAAAVDNSKKRPLPITTTKEKQKKKKKIE